MLPAPTFCTFVLEDRFHRVLIGYPGDDHVLTTTEWRELAVLDSLDGSGVVIQNPLYFLQIRDSGLETTILGQGEGIFDSPRLQFSGGEV